MLRLKSAPRAPDVVEIEEDARHLALELAGLVPAIVVDVMGRGLVLESGERAWREVCVDLRYRSGGSWTPAISSLALVTDRRILLKTSDCRIVSLWWGSLVGFEPCPSSGYAVLDYGDGAPRLLSGRQVWAIAVVGVAAVYGVEALATHPALERLRARL
ncbi:hypothetical protein [Terrabacter carboxydivorans]|uniref:Uncharacterized protein n=1 Tax=Terrabacter carboxydivorans TaxID=619730 RepID=A0ABN3MGX7_9MICO